jgi:glycosyltransferase involved in cell wall biosynthesis
MSDGRRIRVVFIVSRLGVGGAEAQVLHLANGLDPERFEVFVICQKDAGESAWRLNDSETRLRTVGMHNGSDPRVAGRLARLFRDMRPDIVHCTNFNSTAWGRLAAALAGVPVIVTAEHATSRFSTREALLSRLFNRVLDWKTDAVVACAQAQVPLLEAESNGRSHIRVIHNGVTSAEGTPDRPASASLRIAGLTDDHEVVSIVGALRPVKNHRRFLRMAEEVSGVRPLARFLVVGDGPLRADLETWSRSRGLQERVFFLGVRDDVQRILLRSDVVCLTSDAEALPMSLLEAMALGRPVVSTLVGGVGELVCDGVEGRTVPCRDEQALAAAVISMLEDEAARRRFGEFGRRRVAENFTLERMVEAYEALFEDLIDREGSGR